MSKTNILIFLHFCAFATNSDFLIPISLQPNVIDQFQTLSFVGLINLCLKYQRFAPSDFTDIGTDHFEFETKTQSSKECILVMYFPRKKMCNNNLGIIINISGNQRAVKKKWKSSKQKKFFTKNEVRQGGNFHLQS